jgi:hypothetical protein
VAAEVPPKAELYVTSAVVMPLTQVLVEVEPLVSDCGVQMIYGSFTFEAEKEMSGTSRTPSLGVSAI